jgi:Fic family protein
LLQQNPFVTATALVEQTGLTAPTVNAALGDLQRLKIVDEVTGRRRGCTATIKLAGSPTIILAG